MSNLDLLTQSHTAVAAKKRVKCEQVNEIIFDDNARREFLTGFHKRKVAKTDAAKKRTLDREKQERLEARREQRRQLRERAIENAAQVESTYHALLGPVDPENQDIEEWAGISPDDEGRQKEEEYENQEVIATVTVVEDIDPACFTFASQMGLPCPELKWTGVETSTQQRGPQKGMARDRRRKEREPGQPKESARRTKKAKLVKCEEKKKKKRRELN